MLFLLYIARHLYQKAAIDLLIQLWAADWVVELIRKHKLDHYSPELVLVDGRIFEDFLLLLVSGAAALALRFLVPIHDFERNEN